MTAVAVAGAAVLSPLAANADVDYDGIKYLGGGDQIDLNNANVRINRVISLSFVDIIAFRNETNDVSIDLTRRVESFL